MGLIEERRDTLIWSTEEKMIHIERAIDNVRGHAGDRPTLVQAVWTDNDDTLISVDRSLSLVTRADVDSAKTRRSPRLEVTFFFL